MIDDWLNAELAAAPITQEGGEGCEAVRRLNHLDRVICRIIEREGRDSAELIEAITKFRQYSKIYPLSANISKELIETLARIDQNATSIDSAVQGCSNNYSAKKLIGPDAIAPIDGLCLGSLRVRYSFRSIWGGVVQVAQDVPIAPSITGRLFFVVIGINNSSDVLLRENHGHWGYHYHYARRSKHRSDTILTFDNNIERSPLFSEKHAETDCQFSARPHSWKNPKRQSIYDACAPDLERWPRGPFKLPGKNAVQVWPLPE